MKFFLKQYEKGTRRQIWMLYAANGDGKAYALTGRSGGRLHQLYPQMRRILISWRAENAAWPHLQTVAKSFKKAIDVSETHYSKYMIIDDE